MKVSSSFYLRSWSKNSLMAIGTGFVLGLFTSRVIIVYAPPINALIGALIAFIVYQSVSFSRFFGTRRGEFEYEYRYDLIEKAVRRLVLKYLGFSTFINYFQDQFNSISAEQKDICRKLLRHETVKNNDDIFLIYIKLSSLALKDDNSQEEKSALLSAIEIKPNDLLANYRLALCCEMDGLKDDAINYYRTALKDASLYSEQLRTFISSQIERVTLKGPMNRPPALGCRFMIW